MALPRKLILPFAVVAIFASSVFAPPAHVATLQSKAAVAPIPEPPPLPCSKQNWTNADRICLSWTAPRDKTGEKATAAPKATDGHVAAGRARLPTIRGPYTIT
jgi:hypothetical protein